MIAPKIGSLFSGVGAFDLAVLSVLGGEVVWHSEIDPAGCKVLAARWPGVPNLGDVSAVDWTVVEPVDVVVGGFPCNDVSQAGQRLGLGPGTRSGLWAQMAHAIAALRPRLVVIENVPGLLWARAVGDVEPCPWCLGDDPDEPALRALGAVLADLAELGLDAEWISVPAAEVGACHPRSRVFILAWPADPDGVGPVRARGARDRRDGPAHVDRHVADAAGPGWGQLVEEHVGPDGRPPVRAGETEPRRRDRAAADASCDRRGEGWPEPARLVGGPDAALGGDAVADADGDPVREQPIALAGGGGAPLAGQPVLEWGVYGPAIGRWGLIFGRPAPEPTVTGPRGGQQLSPRFVEWMQGLPEGWVTDVPGVSRRDALRLLGGAVVPQQGAAALRELLTRADDRSGAVA